MKKIKQTIFLLLICFLITKLSYSQDAKIKTKPVCPLSLITHTLGDKLEDRFNIVFKKFPLVVKYDPIPLLCLKVEMSNLISHIHQYTGVNGLRIHFGQDDSDSLRFIFTGTKDTFDITPYYIYDKRVSTFIKISKHELNDLTNRFYKKTIQRFDLGLDDGNTTSYFFGSNQIQDIETVFHNQLIRSEVDSIGIRLGAYICDNPELKCPPPSKGDFTNRLMLAFAFFKSGPTEIYLEDNYCILSENKATAGLDTGSPCPPKSNCP